MPKLRPRGPGYVPSMSRVNAGPASTLIHGGRCRQEAVTFPWQPHAGLGVGQPSASSHSVTVAAANVCHPVPLFVGKVCSNPMYAVFSPGTYVSRRICLGDGDGPLPSHPCERTATTRQVFIHSEAVSNLEWDSWIWPLGEAGQMDRYPV